MKSEKDKFRRTLIDLANSGNFIPGIYNYCDRWCERCILSHKCFTYAHEQKLKEECNDPETNSLDNEKFWEQIRLSFEVTMDMITEDAKRFGINLDDLPDIEEQENVESPLEVMADEYSFAMSEWLKKNYDILQSRDNQLLTKYNKKDPDLKFADAVEVVIWYCYFISAKIHRSFYEIDARMNEKEDAFNLLSDNNGSAKIAIIAINRSIEALTVLYPEMKDQEDEILKFLIQLSKIKKQMLTAFPTAMDFKRPGFDV